MSFEEPSGTQRSEHIYDLKGLATLTLQPQGSDAILLLLCMSPQYESEPSGPNPAKKRGFGSADLIELQINCMFLWVYIPVH